MVGQIIRKMRVAGGFTQFELAQKVNIAQTTLSGYETNNSIPSFNIVYKIADACDFEIAFIDKNNSEAIIMK